MYIMLQSTPGYAHAHVLIALCICVVFTTHNHMLITTVSLRGVVEGE